MVENPYKVLGISEGATAEEIKKAYRQKAKAYHPDLHPDDPKAAAKMNEVNEAYDMLQNPEKYRAQRQQQAQNRQNAYGGWQNGYSQQNGYTRSNSSYQNAGGWTSDFYGFDFGDIFGFGSTNFDTTPRPQNGDPAELIQAIRAVQNSRWQEALTILLRMTSQYRNDRWYYVCAAALQGNGETSRAQDMIERAIQMRPDNRMYRQFRQEIIQQTRNQAAYTRADTGVSISPLRIFGRIALGIILFRLLFRMMGMFFFF